MSCNNQVGDKKMMIQFLQNQWPELKPQNNVPTQMQFAYGLDEIKYIAKYKKNAKQIQLPKNPE